MPELGPIFIAIGVLAAIGLLACLANIVAQVYGRQTPAWVRSLAVLTLVLGFLALSNMLTFEHDLSVERSIAIGFIVVSAGGLISRKTLSAIAAHKFVSTCVLLIVVGAAMLGVLFVSVQNAPSFVTLVAILPIAVGIAGLTISLTFKFRPKSSISNRDRVIDHDDR
jgi:hypothetical protein